MASVQRFLEIKLKLRVNEAKSAVDRPQARKLLGFSLYHSQNGVGIRLAPRSVELVKAKIRELTDRNWSVSMEERIKRINQYLSGWLGYFALADAKKTLIVLQGWLQRRLRACLWVQWKRPRTRFRHLRHLDLPEWKVCELANARKGPWRMANGPLNSVLTVQYWRPQGLIDLVDRYFFIRQIWRTAVCRTARTVV